MDYSPIRSKYASDSEMTQALIRRKRALLFSGGTADEWLTLAEEFLADGGRANHAFCMYEFKRMGGQYTGPVAFTFVPEPEVPADYTDV